MKEGEMVYVPKGPRVVKDVVIVIRKEREKKRGFASA